MAVAVPRRDVVVQVSVDDAEAARRLRLLVAGIASAESRLESLEARLAQVKQDIAEAETAKVKRK